MKPSHLFPCLALLLLSACQLEDPQAGLITEDIIDLAAADSVILADGESLVVLTSILGPGADPNLDVTFSANAGSFETSTGPQSSFTRRASGREAEAILVAGTQVSPRVRIGASVSGTEANENYTFKDEEIIRFARAYPERLELALSEAEVQATSGVTLSLELGRQRGTVSDGTEVLFQAQFQGEEGLNLELPNSFVVDSETGTVSIINPDTLTGEARITAFVLDEEGDTAVVNRVSLSVLR